MYPSRGAARGRGRYHAHTHTDSHTHTHIPSNVPAPFSLASALDELEGGAPEEVIDISTDAAPVSRRDNGSNASRPGILPPPAAPTHTPAAHTHTHAHTHAHAPHAGAAATAGTAGPPAPRAEKPSTPRTISEYASCLSPWLGPGLPPLLLAPVCTGTARDMVVAAPCPVAGEGTRGKDAGGATGGQHPRGVPIAGPSLARVGVTSASAGRLGPAGQPGLGPAVQRVWTGASLRSPESEERMLRAVLALPLHRIISTELLANLASGSGPVRTDVSEPAHTPVNLLPHVPKPRFHDFFSDTPSSAATVPASPSSAWPGSWTAHHATFCALLLEEARAAMSGCIHENLRSAAKEGKRARVGGVDPGGVWTVKPAHGRDSIAADMVTLELHPRAFPAGRAAGRETYGHDHSRGEGGQWTTWQSRDVLLLVRERATPSPRAECDAFLAIVNYGVRNDRRCITARTMARDVPADIFVRSDDPRSGVAPSHPSLPRPGQAPRGAPTAGPWRVFWLGSLATLLYQVQSLDLLAYTPFRGAVLTPNRAARRPDVTSIADAARTLHISRSLLKELQHRFDDSQLVAMFTIATGGRYFVPYGDTGTAAAGGCEVTCIIGPPGTGKTRTLIGALSLLRASKLASGRAASAASNGSIEARAPVPVPALAPQSRPTDTTTRSPAIPARTVAQYTPALDLRPDESSRAACTAGAAAASSNRAEVIDLTLDSGNEESSSAESTETSSSSETDEEAPSFLRQLAPTISDKHAFARKQMLARAGASHSRPLAATAIAAARTQSTSGEARGRGHKSSQGFRVLVCAPSNAAVDEIAARLVEDRELARTGAADSDSGDSTEDEAPAPAAHPARARGAGMVNEKGRPHVPRVLRLGVGTSASRRFRAADVSGDASVLTAYRKLVVSSAASRQQHLRPSNDDVTYQQDQLRRELADLKKELGHLEAASGIHDSVLRGSVSGAPAPPSFMDSLLGSVDVGGGARPRTDVIGAPATAHAVSTPSRERGSATVAARADVLRSPGVHRRIRELRQEVEARELELRFERVRQLITANEHRLLAARAVHQCVLEAEVVICTLAGAAKLFTSLATAAVDTSDLLDPEAIPRAGFDAIVIDEAGQSIEPEALIPLRHAYFGYVHDAAPEGGAERAAASSRFVGACRRLVLVGDPIQLPATVVSPSAAQAGLATSLFERIAASGIKPLVLQWQYRMPPAISAFESRHFYHGLVRDGPRAPMPPSHDVCVQASLLVCRVKGEELRHGDAHGEDTEDIDRAEAGSKRSLAAAATSAFSLSNAAEARAALAVALHLADALSVHAPQIAADAVPGDSHAAARRGGRVVTQPLAGIISPYRSQVQLLRHMLTRLQSAPRPTGDTEGAALLNRLGSLSRRIVIATVDGFQGQELPAIVLSFVRSKMSASRGALGFVKDPRRLNVALSRAQRCLALVGNMDYLAASDPDFAALIEHASSAGSPIEFPPRRLDAKPRPLLPTPLSGDGAASAAGGDATTTRSNGEPSMSTHATGAPHIHCEGYAHWSALVLDVLRHG